MADKIKRTDEEWRKELTPMQFAVTREKATEAPFSGEYEKTTTPGLYRCICCGETLFESDTKFDAGCGWPSFTKPVGDGNRMGGAIPKDIRRQQTEFNPIRNLYAVLGKYPLNAPRHCGPTYAVRPQIVLLQ